jgi:hypothetical protein
VSRPLLTGDTKRQIRAYVAQRDGMSCYYCSRPFPDLYGVTLDHYIPYCLWPMNKPRNLVLACAPCNQAKADRLPLPFALALLASVGQLHGALAASQLPLLARAAQATAQAAQARRSPDLAAVVIPGPARRSTPVLAVLEAA